VNLLKNSDGPLLGTRRSARSPSATIHPSSRGHFFLQAKIQPPPLKCSSRRSTCPKHGLKAVQFSR
jgi:hypothetical protein